MDEDQVPEWVQTAKMYSKSNDHHINYLLCNNTASLIYMATVSTPLKWEEVKQSLTPQMYTIQNIPERLESIGDIWQPVMKKGVILNKALPSIEKLA